MKTKHIIFGTLTLGLLLGAQSGAVASLVNYSASYVDNVTIPDNNLSGISESVTLNTGIQSITSVQVSLDIAGGYNGDYYAYLTDGTGFAVLLNRVGVNGSSAYGYGDSGFNVTFSDTAAYGNIHNYQSVVNPGGGALTGTWQPDGRNISPLTSDATLAATPSTAMLSSFDGQDADTTWTLFIADTSPGGVGELEGWSLQVAGNGATVPECTNKYVLPLLMSLCFWSTIRRGKKPVRRGL